MKIPFVIRLFSYLFIYLAVASIGCLSSAWSSPALGQNLSIGFLTAEFKFSSNPLLFSALSLLFILAGVVGFFILRRKSFAYDLGIFYSVASLLFLGTLAVLQIGRKADVFTSFIVLSLTFGWFLCI
jgi:hypothetical protein